MSFNGRVIGSAVGNVIDLFSKSLAQTSAPAGLLGVDIGSHSVKIVRLEAGKDNFKVLGFGIEKVADKNYRDALSRAMVKAGVSSDQSAVLSVSGQGVVSRYIELPLMNKSELESSMKFEIEKYVPFPLGEVSVDYAVVNEMREKAKMVVLIVAAKNELVARKCNIAKEVNLNLRGMDLDCLALANFASEIAGVGGEGNCYGIINIGKTVSNIDIMAGGIPYLSRDIFIGGDEMTKKLAETLELEYPEAEKLKIDPGKKKEELTGILDPVLNNLAAEIRVSLDYFEARNNMAVDRIYVSGGSSRIEGLEDYMNHLLAVDVSKLDYCGNLKFDEAVDVNEFKASSDFLAIASGLALR